MLSERMKIHVVCAKNIMLIENVRCFTKSRFTFFYFSAVATADEVQFFVDSFSLKPRSISDFGSRKNLCVLFIRIYPEI